MLQNSVVGSNKTIEPLRLLFIHEVDWLNKVVFEIHDIPELLSIRGHDVTVLDYPESSAGMRRVRTRLGLSRAWNESCIRLVSPPVLCGPRVGRWLVALLALPLILRVIRQHRPDVIITYAVPTYGWQAILAARLLRIPIVYRAIDAVPELRPGIHRPLVALAERFTCRFTNFVSTHNEALRDRCMRLGTQGDRVQIMVPGVDSSHLYPASPDHVLATQLGIQRDDKVLVFMGTLFRFAQLDQLIRELKPTMKTDRSLKLLVIGDGEMANEIRNLSASEELGQQVLMVGMIDYANLPRYLRLGAVGLLPFASNTISHNALPNKVLQYLACGLPAVAIRLQGLASVIPEGHGVIYVETLSELASEAIALAESFDELTRQRQRAVEYCRQNLQWDEKIVTFETFLTRISHSW